MWVTYIAILKEDINENMLISLSFPRLNSKRTSAGCSVFVFFFLARKGSIYIAENKELH